MRGLVIFLLILAVVASFSFVVVNINNQKTETKEKTKKLEFATFTSAVCENEEEVVHCRDEVFVNCNGKISKATDIVECNGTKLDMPKATGFAIFEKEWKDPRS